MSVHHLYGQLTQGAVQNMATGDFSNFLFNPEQLSRQIGVNYTTLKTRGGSHGWNQYDNTDNVKVPLKIVYSLSAYAELSRHGNEKFTRADELAIRTSFEDERNFFVEMCYPVGRPNDPLLRAPPTMLLMYPANTSMEFIVKSYQDSDTVFDTDMNTMIFTVSLQLEEQRTWRLTSAEARRIGFKRAKPKLG